MNLIQTIKAKFQLKRVIANGSFIPEIDGLRFIAITTVVVYHIIGFLTIKNKNVFEQAFHNSFLARFASNGHYGVELFFVISGFILALPSFITVRVSDAIACSLS